MKIMDVAYYSIIKNFKDIRTFSFVVVASIVMIAILGTALDGEYSPKNLQQEKIVYLREDEGPQGLQFDEFLKEEKLQQLLSINKVEDYQEALRLLNNGEANSFIYIPQGFSEGILNNEKTEIKIISNGKTPTVKAIIDNYVKTTNGMIALYSLGNIQEPIRGGSYIKEVTVTTDGKAPRAIDYYSVQTLLQLLIVGALYGISAVREDEEKNTIIRIKSAPVTFNEIIAGKTIASILALFIQSLIVMGFSRYVYKANWGGNLLINLSIIFLFVAIVIGTGILIGLLIKNSIAAMGTIYGLMMLFSITSGAISKEATGGRVGELLSKISPNYYASRAIFSNAYGGDISLMKSYIGILVIMTIGIYVTSFFIGRRSLQ